MSEEISIPEITRRAGILPALAQPLQR